MHLHIYDNSIITFGIIGFCLGFSNTSHVYSLDRFRKIVVGEIKTDLWIVLKDLNEKNYMKIQYSNELVQNLGVSDPTTCI